MTLKTIIVLSAGTFVMMLLILLLMKRYGVRLWKSAPVAVLLTVVGTVSTYIWFFVESSMFGARSYYGAVFLVPVCFLAAAKWMRIPYGDLMDFSAPAECAMLVLMKYQCLVDGCCAGRVLYFTPEGTVVFPSQIVETVNAAVIMVILFCMAFSLKNRGKIYPWYLVLYGVTRFILNWFRADTDPLLMGLPAGNLWSLIAIIIGVLWIRGYRLAIVKASETEPMTQPLSRE